MTKILFALIFLNYLVKNVIGEARPHTIKFHVPNDVDVDGKLCSLRRPHIQRTCPVFGIYTENKNQQQVVEECAKYNFKCDEGLNLMIDGSCEACPDGLVLIEAEDDIYCQDPNNPTITKFKGLNNPFNCIDDDPLIIKRTVLNTYRPCYKFGDVEVNAQYYVSSDDLSDIFTLRECAYQISNYTRVPLPGQQFEIDRVMQDIPFAAIGSNDEQEYAEVGYIQCTRGRPESKDYLTPGWIAWYTFNIVAVAYCAFFGFLKYILESNIKNSKKSNVTYKSSESTNEAFEEAEFLAQTNSTQKGYKNTIFGSLGYYVFVLLSIGVIVFLILIVLDMFGLNYFLLCKGQPDVDAACDEAISSGVDPNWRMGWVCANGCLLDQATTRGDDPEWPYYAIPGGGSKNGIAFIIVWHVAFLWLIFLKMFINQINSFFYIRCPLNEATHILIEKPIEEEIITQSNAKSTIRQISNVLADFINKYKGKPSHSKLCKIQNVNGIRYFDFQCLRYCWNDSNSQYQVSYFPIEDTQKNILKNFNGLSESTAFSRFKMWGSNAIEIEIPPLLIAIFSEFFDYLYMYQLLTLLNWIYTNYYIPPLVSFTIIILSATIKIVTKRKSQWKVKKMVHKSIPISVSRNGNWQVMQSINLVPGDLIKITESCTIPCDAILLDGRCIIDESTLTGEPTPVPKISLSPTSDQIYDNSQANLKYTLFAGSYLQSFSPGQSGSTIAVVFATGASTYKGKLIRDLLFPPPISFTFEQHIYAVYCVLFAWGIVIMAIIIWFLEGVLSSWVLSTFVVSHIVNPLIPAVYVAALSQGAIHLSKNNVYCINFQRMSVAGKIKTFCFDKTGTLTLPGLEFRGLQYYTKGSNKFEQFGTNDKYPRLLKMLCGCCNELDFINEKGNYHSVGNEVDVALFESSGYEYDVVDNVSIITQGSNRIKVLRRFEFDRATMTMSVIVEDENGHKYVFTKGSYEVISRLVEPDSLPKDYFQKADSLAKKGNYILGMAYKNFDDDLDVFKVTRQSVETDIICLGLIMFENPLKQDTREIIDEIKNGKINTRILTGDNSLTASYIARLSGISTSNRIILGDLESNKSENVIWKDFDSDQITEHPLKMFDRLKSGEIDVAITGRLYLRLHALRHNEHLNDKHISQKHTLNLALDNSELSTLLPYIRIYSRLTPDQKVLVMAEQMQLNLTGMCGDGANDVGALRLAHCGVAIAAGSSEAGIVSHFSSPNGSLKAVVDVLKEGRSTLSKAMSGFKTLIVFGQTKGLVGVMQHYFAVIPAEFFWITWDSIVYVGMSWCLLQSHPSKKLTNTRPTAKMFGFETLFSTLSTIFINYAFFCGGIAFLYTFDWFLCNEFNPNNIDHLQWWLKGDNYEAQIMSYMATFNFLGAAPAYSFGFEYRTHWYKNYWLIIFFILVTAFYSYVFVGGTSTLSCFARINCGDSTLIQKWIDTGYMDLRITEPPSTASVGCSCDEQFGNRNVCINGDYFQGCCTDEYINCPGDQYNSGIHHNIMPTRDAWKFWFLGMGNVLAVVFWEGIIVLGPIRQMAKRWKEQRKLDRK